MKIELKKLPISDASRQLPPGVDDDGGLADGDGGGSGESASESKSIDWRTDFLFEFWAGGKPGGTVAREYLCNHVMMAPNNTYAGVRTIDGMKLVVFEEPARKTVKRKRGKGAKPKSRKGAGFS